MMRRRSYKKQNRGGHPEKRFGLWDMAGIGCMALILASAEPFLLSAQAEPATLKSPDATVYEQPGEGSNPVGNLVEGGSFEYTGDVTAEDGSVWHQITTAGGVNGYIRGDREIEMGAEEDAEGRQEAATGEGVNGGEAGQPSETDPDVRGEAETNPVGEEAVSKHEEGTDNGGEEPEEEEDAEEEETGQDGDEGALEGDAGEDLGEDGAVTVFHMQNNQAKKYVMERSQKVKEKENFTQLDIETDDVTGKRAGIDLSLVAVIMVVLICGGAIYVCVKRIKRISKGKGEAGGSTPDVNKPKPRRKAERKKHNQKKKSTRIIQGKKRI